MSLGRRTSTSYTRVVPEKGGVGKRNSLVVSWTENVVSASPAGLPNCKGNNCVN